jgi:hypothetical protein
MYESDSVAIISRVAMSSDFRTFGVRFKERGWVLGVGVLGSAFKISGTHAGTWNQELFFSATLKNIT